MKLLALLVLLWTTPAPPQGDAVAVRLIVVRTEAEANAILSRLQAGAVFEDLARSRSSDRSAADGGYIGTFERAQLRAEFQAALSGLKAGEFSGVIRLGREFALLQNAVIAAPLRPSPRDVQQSWAAALNGNDIGKVRQLLAGGPADIVYDDGSTILMGAAQAGQTEMVRALVAAGASVRAQAADGTTALTAAAFSGHAEIIRILLAAGADPNLRLRDGSTALMKAAQAGHAEIVKALIDAGAKPDIPARNGLTALMDAAFAAHLAVVRTLLDAKANVNASLDNGSTALMAAAQKGGTEIVAALLAAGASVKAKTATGGTALMEAAYNGHLDTVRLLLKSGSELDAVTAEGLTALMGSALGGHTAVVSALLEAGAAADLKDQKGWTALTHARASSTPATVRILLPKTAGITPRERSLILGGAYINEYYASGEKKLLDAAAAEFQKAVDAGSPDASALEWLGATEVLRWDDAPSLEQYRKAVLLLKRSADLDPRDPDRQYWIAAVNSMFLSRGKPASAAERTSIIDEGIRYAQKAIELDSEFSDAMDHLSVLYRLKGETAAAADAHANAERIRVRRGNRPSRFNDQFSRPAPPAAPKF